MPDDMDNPNPEGSEMQESADELYTRGMAHYRRREWQDAKRSFQRLKSVAPERRGVDALLNEVDLFLQLEAMQPARTEEEARGQAVQPAEEEPVEEVRPPLPRKPKRAARPSSTRRKSPWSAILIILALLMIAFAILYATGGLDSLLGSQRQARVQILVNQGRAALNVGDYDRAVEVFGEALALAPTSEEVKTWYAKAQRYQQLASLYEQADTEIAAQRWEPALERLERILAIDPTYRDTSTKVEYIKNRQTLDSRFIEAKAVFGSGKWEEAIKLLEPLHEQAPDFRGVLVGHSHQKGHRRKQPAKHLLQRQIIRPLNQIVSRNA